MFQFNPESVFSRHPAELKFFTVLAVSAFALFFRDAFPLAVLFAFSLMLVLLAGPRAFPKLLLSIAPFLFLTDLSFLLFLSAYIPNIWEVIIVSNLRMAAIFLSFAFFSLSTDVFSLVKFFKRIHLPKTIYLSLYIVFRFFPEIERDFREIRQIQRLRGYSGKNPFSYLKATLFPLVFLLFERIDEISVACYLREKRGETFA